MLKRLIFVLACLGVPTNIYLMAFEKINPGLGIGLGFLCFFIIWKLHYSKSDLNAELTIKE